MQNQNDLHPIRASQLTVEGCDEANNFVAGGDRPPRERLGAHRTRCSAFRPFKIRHRLIGPPAPPANMPITRLLPNLLAICSVLLLFGCAATQNKAPVENRQPVRQGARTPLPPPCSANCSSCTANSTSRGSQRQGRLVAVIWPVRARRCGACA